MEFRRKSDIEWGLTTMEKVANGSDTSVAKFKDER